VSVSGHSAYESACDFLLGKLARRSHVVLDHAIMTICTVGYAAVFWSRNNHAQGADGAEN